VDMSRGHILAQPQNAEYTDKLKYDNQDQTVLRSYFVEGEVRPRGEVRDNLFQGKGVGFRAQTNVDRGIPY